MQLRSWGGRPNSYNVSTYKALCINTGTICLDDLAVMLEFHHHMRIPPNLLSRGLTPVKQTILCILFLHRYRPVTNEEVVMINVSQKQ